MIILSEKSKRVISAVVPFIKPVARFEDAGKGSSLASATSISATFRQLSRNPKRWSMPEITACIPTRSSSYLIAMQAGLVGHSYRALLSSRPSFVLTYIINQAKPLLGWNAASVG